MRFVRLEHRRSLHSCGLRYGMDHEEYDCILAFSLIDSSYGGHPKGWNSMWN